MFKYLHRWMLVLLAGRTRVALSLALGSLIWVTAACMAAQPPATLPAPPATPLPSDVPQEAPQAVPPTTSAPAPVPDELPASTSTPVASHAAAQDAAAKAKFEGMCEPCHGVFIVTTGRRLHGEWAMLVEEMISRGAQGTAADVETVVDYLTRHYGKINVNTASADAIAMVLEVTPEQAKSIVDCRTNQGEFKTVADLEKVQGIDPKVIQERRDRIAFSGD